MNGRRGVAEAFESNKKISFFARVHQPLLVRAFWVLLGSAPKVCASVMRPFPYNLGMLRFKR